MTAAPVHLGYCTNIHPAESWAETRALLAGPVRAVKAATGESGAFGVGLRLAARAAYELEQAGDVAEVRAELAEAGLYVFSLNGFPYGAFHGTRVKEAVYRPDWLEDERVRYTSALARVACELLPPGLEGSISTVPGAFAERASGATERRLIARNVMASAAQLIALERERGRTLRLALEPEPACLLETIAETIDFFENELCASDVLEELARRTGTPRSSAETLLRRHVGVCLDTCHASVEFESPREALATLAARGIAVPKIQLSAGLRLENASPDALALLEGFSDDVYLHQTVVHAEGKLTRFLDLPQALSAAGRFANDAEWRVHFHVPVCEPSFGLLSSTQADLEALLLGAPELAPHLEVETYTFGVLPEAHRNVTMIASIARELAWVRGVLARRAPPRADEA